MKEEFCREDAEKSEDGMQRNKFKEARTQLMTQVYRVTGSLHPITNTIMDGNERIILDGTYLTQRCEM